MTDTENLTVGIDFPGQEWTTWNKPGAVGRVKMTHVRGQRLRLLELPAGFAEEEWCLRGHTGYVVQGEFVVRFDDHEVPCGPGMAFTIPDGVRHRSRGMREQATVVFVVDEVPPS